MDDKDLTREERKAIAALRKLSERWPRTLRVQMLPTVDIAVFKVSDENEFLSSQVAAFPNTMNM